MSAIAEKLFKSFIGNVFDLAKICDIVKGQQINGEFLKQSGKYYVMNGGTEPSGYFDKYNTPANTISISEGGSCGYVQYNNKPFWSGGHCYTLISKDDSTNYNYLYHFLKCNERHINALRSGSCLPNIQKKDLGKFKVQIPTMKQQKAIASCLSALERKSEIETSLFAALQCKKRYLLLKMFI